MHSAVNSILKGLSSLYGFGVFVRNWLYDQGLLRSYPVPVPVICVGNLSVGGNAKTPLVRFIVESLVQRGFKPVVLSRGYGGRKRGPHLVEKHESAKNVGDEPLLLRQVTGVPVVIARDRVRGARYICEQELGDVIILDDGFQHRRLARDLDILTVNVTTQDSINDFTAGQLLPLGRFREPRLPGLKRAHMLVFTNRQVAVEEAKLSNDLFASVPDNLQLYRAHLEYDCITTIGNQDQSLSLDSEVIVMTGIANPEGFVHSVQSVGLSILEKFLFADHHFFSQKDIDEVRDTYPDSPIICTEKDAVKLGKLSEDNLFVLKTKLVVVPADAFIVGILKVIN